MMSSLVSGNFASQLEAQNGTILAWVTDNFGGSMTAGQTYNYFTGYFPSGFAGYYNNGTPPMSYPYYGMIGFIDLTTGVLRAFSGDAIPSNSQLLSWATEANQ